MQVKSTQKAHFLMIVWTIIVGASFLVVREITPGLPAMAMTALRFLSAAIVLLPWVMSLPEKWPKSKKAIRSYIILGFCLAGFFSSMFIAADYLSAVDMSVWYMAVPLFAFILGVILQVEKWRWFRFAILLLGMLGAVLLALGAHDQIFSLDTLSVHFGKGEQIFLTGCLMMAFYPVLSKRYILKKEIIASPLLTTFWSLLIGGASIAMIATLSNDIQWSVLFEKANIQDYLWILYLGVGSSAFTFFLMQKATLNLMPTQIVSYNFLVPVVSLLVIWFHFPDRIQPITLLGMGIVIAVIILLNKVKS